MSPLDLHVLGTPPAFVLSQDQTLVFNPSMSQSKFPFRFPFPSTLNSSESSLSFAASPASLPLPLLRFPFRSASPRLLSSCAFLSSVSFSRFGPLSLVRPPGGGFPRASLQRITDFHPLVNTFFEKNLKKSEENQRFRTLVSLTFENVRVFLQTLRL